MVSEGPQSMIYPGKGIDLFLQSPGWVPFCLWCSGSQSAVGQAGRLVKQVGVSESTGEC